MKMIILISQNEDEDFDNDDDNDYLMVIAEVMVLTSEESKIDQCNDKKYPDGKLKADDDYCALMMLWNEMLSCLFLLSHPYFLAVLSLTGFPSPTWLCHLYEYRIHIIHILCSTTFHAIHFCKELFNEKNRPLNDDTAIIGLLLRIPQNDLCVVKSSTPSPSTSSWWSLFYCHLATHPLLDNPRGGVFNRFLTSQYNQQHKQLV